MIFLACLSDSEKATKFFLPEVEKKVDKNKVVSILKGSFLWAHFCVNKKRYPPFQSWWTFDL